MSEGVGHFATLKEVDWKLEPVELIGGEGWGGDDRLLH